ncbi:MAG: DUF3078 domain-containing protein [Bacteroidales bacterium]|nr:DUF3078 domain-containing protein [Bacteroidales bacterium]
MRSVLSKYIVALVVVFMAFSFGPLKAQDVQVTQDTIKVPTYEELARMYTRLVAQVDSARQRAMEDSILIARFVEESRQAALAAMPEPKKPTFWTNSILSQISFTQTSLTNWAAGGNSSVSLAGHVDAKANYAKNDIIFQNRFQAGYGFVKMFGDILKKTDDRLFFDSKFGYKATERLYMSAALGVKTQMAKGYKYTANDTTLVSQFAAPLNSTLALGMDYNPLPWLSITFAPLTGGIVVVTVPELREDYGNKSNEKVRVEFGAQLKAKMDKEVFKNVKVDTELILFSDYLNKPQNIQVYWDLSISMQINKFMSANIRTNLIYDDNIKIADKYGNKAPRVQFREILSIGFSYTLSNK